MKTTKANYAKHAAAIKIGDMPDALQASYKTIRKNTDTYRDWSAFSTASGPDYLDLYFKKFDAWRKSDANTATSDARKAAATTRKAKSTRTGTKRRTTKAPAVVKTAMSAPAERAEKIKDTASRAKAETDKKRGRGFLGLFGGPKATPTAGTKKASRAASNERSLIKVKDADTLSGLSLLRERDKLAKQIHQRSKTKAVRELPVYGISISTAKKRAYDALKATKDGKVKNVKIKTRPAKK